MAFYQDTCRGCLAAAGAPLPARMPLIPGVNDDPENIAATAEFLRQNGQESIHCLPYHNLGEAKLSRIDTSLKPLGLARREPRELSAVVNLSKGRGIHAVRWR